MPKRNGLKRYIDLAIEAYDLGATPKPSMVLRYISPEAEDWTPESREIARSRTLLLQHGIDVKGIVSKFLGDLERKHGSKRSDRFIEWLEGRPVSSMCWWQRMELKADRRRLSSIVRRYKVTG